MAEDVFKTLLLVRILSPLIAEDVFKALLLVRTLSPLIAEDVSKALLLVRILSLLIAEVVSKALLLVRILRLQNVDIRLSNRRIRAVVISFDSILEKWAGPGLGDYCDKMFLPYKMITYARSWLYGE